MSNDFKIPNKNIIGFKILKSSFIGNNGSNFYIDLSIPEIPKIACDNDESGNSIITRIPLQKANDNHYTHQFLELSLVDRYFFPINLDKLTFNLTKPMNGFCVFELSYLNEGVHKDP